MHCVGAMVYRLRSFLHGGNGVPCLCFLCVLRVRSVSYRLCVVSVTLAGVVCLVFCACCAGAMCRIVFVRTSVTVAGMMCPMFVRAARALRVANVTV